MADRSPERNGVRQERPIPRSPNRSPSRRMSSSHQMPQSRSYNDLQSIDEDGSRRSSAIGTSISNPAPMQEWRAGLAPSLRNRTRTMSDTGELLAQQPGRFRRLSSHSGPLSNQELIELAERMNQDLDIRKRHRRFKSHERCFTGSDACAWLVKHRLAGTPAEAEALGAQLLRLGLLFHVEYKHGFRNKDYLYRFHEVQPHSEDDEDGADSFRRSPMSAPAPASQAPSDERWHPGAEIVRLQRRVVDQMSKLEEYKMLSGAMFDEASRRQKIMQFSLDRLQRRLDLVLTSRSFSEAAPAPVSPAGVQRLQLQLAAASLGLVCIVGGVGTSLFAPCLLLLVALSSVWDASRQLQAQGDEPQLGHTGPGMHHRSTASTDLLYTPSLPASLASLPSDSDSEAEHPAHVSSLASLPRDSNSEAERLARVSRVQSGIHGAEAQSQAQSPPTPEDFRGWPDAPLLLRPRQLPGFRVPCADNGRVRLNTSTPIEFETALFQGRAVIHVANLPSAPEGLFAGKRRKTAITVQGQFLQTLSLDDLVTGQEFPRAAQNLPAKWLLETVLLQLARKISPSMVIGPMHAPHVLAPLVAMAQEVNVSEPGSEPTPGGPIPEDMRLLHSDLADKKGQPLEEAARKRYFWSKANRAKHRFEPGQVWTFTMYQHFVDMASYELDMLKRFDLACHLDGMPLQFMVKDQSSGQYLFNFEAWHEKLLPAALAHFQTHGSVLL